MRLRPLKLSLAGFHPKAQHTEAVGPNSGALSQLTMKHKPRWHNRTNPRLHCACRPSPNPYLEFGLRKLVPRKTKAFPPICANPDGGSYPCRLPALKGARPGDRTGVVEGKSVSARVDLGGRRT